LEIHYDPLVDEPQLSYEGGTLVNYLVNPFTCTSHYLGKLPMEVGKYHR
jgi:hypothetical protein